MQKDNQNNMGGEWGSDEGFRYAMLLASARTAEAEANLVAMMRADDVEICWNCGGDVIQVMHCIKCDQDSSVCSCEDFTWWRISRCVSCDSAWGD